MKSKFSITQFLNNILNRKNLNMVEAEALMEEMLMGNLTNVQMAAILMALAMKGESVDELIGFITIMRKYMKNIKTYGRVIDTCGTGGDGSGTFNISTATALVVAGAGVRVAKHGNRAISSSCGSADCFEALGVNINLNSKQAERCLSKVGITFLFAPLYHPAMKYVSSIRKDLGIRTVFNFLGPFVSPANVKRQMIGVPNTTIARKLVEVARKLDYEHLLIVTSSDGLDELSIFAPSYIFEVKGKYIKKLIIDPKKLGFNSPSKEGIRGGDAIFNAQIIRRILEGEEGRRRDIVVLNSAGALYVSGKVKNIEEGIKLANKSIDCGKAKEVLKTFGEISQKN